jgi:hypothetical protein
LPNTEAQTTKVKKKEVRYELKVNNTADDITDYRLNWKKEKKLNLLRNKMTLEYLAKIE